MRYLKARFPDAEHASVGRPLDSGQVLCVRLKMLQKWKNRGNWLGYTWAMRCEKKKTTGDGDKERVNVRIGAERKVDILVDRERDNLIRLFVNFN